MPRRLRVLMLTPYSPLAAHEHAAADLAAPLVSALSKSLDLHVYSPTSPVFDTGEQSVEGVTYYSGIGRPTPSSGRLSADLYPRVLRDQWPREASQAVKRLEPKLAPDIVHLEYLQTCDALSVISGRSTITLHDLASALVGANLESNRLKAHYWRLQDALILRAQALALRRCDHVFTLSPADATEIEAHVRGVTALQVGVDSPSESWRYNASRGVRAVFAGALSRDANQRSARFLAQEVWPHVLEKMPTATLRIVGSGATSATLQLARLEGVEVPGPVESFEAEYLASSVVAAPSVVPAGVLLKALKAMACGTPTILNSNSARAFPKSVLGRVATVADSAEDFAEAIILASTQRETAERLGQAGREFVKDAFSWSAYAQQMIKVFEKLSLS